MTENAIENPGPTGIHRGFYDIEPSTEVAQRPPGGHVYLFKWDDPARKEDWRADGYNWRQNGGGDFTLEGIRGRKIYFKLITGRNMATKQPIMSNVFTKNAYVHPSHPQRVLIQYIGDETVAVPLYHGNRRKKKIGKPFVRTPPSVLHSIPRSGTPSNIYRSMTQSDASGPRDLKQISNAQSVARRKMRHTSDAIHKIYEMAKDHDSSEPTFIKFVAMAPQLQVLAFNDELVEIYKRLVKREEPICIGYRTAVKLTSDFYASFLTIRESEFNELPVIPLMVMIHTQMTAETHSLFWESVDQHFPELAEANSVFLITGDGRKEALEAITKQMPLAEVFRCPDGILQDVEKKLKAMGIRNDEIKTYQDDITELFNQISKLQYMERLTSCMVSWDREFSAYFHTCIHPHIDRIAGWCYTPHNLGPPPSSKLPECIQAAIDKILEWKDAPIHTIVVCLNQLFKACNAEITKSLYGKGKYHLQPDYVVQYDRSQPIPQFPEVETADEIVSKIRQTYESENVHLAVYARAKEMVEGGSEIKLDGKGKLTVKDSDGRLHSVQLFPRHKCTCQSNPSSAPCAHVVACKIMIGLDGSDLADPRANKYGRKSNQRRSQGMDHDYLSTALVDAIDQAAEENNLNSIDESDLTAALCVCTEDSIMEESVENITVTMDESSIPIITESGEAASNLKIYVICESDQAAAPAGGIGANEEVDMEQ